MRLFLFLSLLAFPALSFGQACTEATLRVADTNTDGDGNPNTYPCTTLVVNGIVNRLPDGSTSPIIVTVSGDVTINANISVNGGNGILLTADGDPGPNGGPGAVSAGGGILGNEGQPSFSLNPEDGIAPPRNGGCNDGGGGGAGFSANGDSGLTCAGTTSAAAPGGTSWGSIFPTTHGGFGGAAGGAHDNAGAFSVGSGGGGGGAIHIISTGGSITIKSGVTISARGGRGGNSTNIGGGGFGGGGGGGSGGVILLDAFVGVTNNGSLDVRGGARGTSPGGGHGGAGKSGVYRVVVNGATIVEGTEVSTPTITNNPITKYKSDISCGTVAKKNEDQNLNLMFQMMMGFALIALLKTLFRFPKKVA